MNQVGLGAQTEEDLRQGGFPVGPRKGWRGRGRGRYRWRKGRDRGGTGERRHRHEHLSRSVISDRKFYLKRGGFRSYQRQGLGDETRRKT